MKSFTSGLDSLKQKKINQNNYFLFVLNLISQLVLSTHSILTDALDMSQPQMHNRAEVAE